LNKFLCIDRDLEIQIKRIVRLSNANVGHSYEALFVRLQSKNSKLRYLALLLCDVIFLRSKHFRELLVGDLKRFVELTIGTGKPLPPPHNVAKTLKNTALVRLDLFTPRELTTTSAFRVS
jgi:hypothetical protein